MADYNSKAVKAVPRTRDEHSQLFCPLHVQLLLSNFCRKVGHWPPGPTPESQPALRVAGRPLLVPGDLPRPSVRPWCARWRLPRPLPSVVILFFTTAGQLYGFTSIGGEWSIWDGCRFTRTHHAYPDVRAGVQRFACAHAATDTHPQRREKSIFARHSLVRYCYTRSIAPCIDLASCVHAGPQIGLTRQSAAARPPPDAPCAPTRLVRVLACADRELWVREEACKVACVEGLAGTHQWGIKHGVD